jgi:outer membrane immunogenic protein
MKKLALALVALAASIGSASAADLARRPMVKAPPPVVPAVSWTGCWISGGGGYAIAKTDRQSRDVVTGVTNVLEASSGSDGWLATAGIGCDYQVAPRWVIGAFVDGTYSDINGDHAWRVFGPGATFVGESKMDWNWAVGGRVGYLVNPNFLTYVNAGYTQGHWEGYNLQEITAPFAATGLQVPGQTFDGWFIGTGVEYAFDWLPGLFIKSEGRASYYDRRDSRLSCVALGTQCGAADIGTDPFGNIDSRKHIVYTAKTELVYRFNWGGPVVAKY